MSQLPKGVANDWSYLGSRGPTASIQDSQHDESIDGSTWTCLDARAQKTKIRWRDGDLMNNTKIRKIRSIAKYTSEPASKTNENTRNIKKDEKSCTCLEKYAKYASWAWIEPELNVNWVWIEPESNRNWTKNGRISTPQLRQKLSSAQSKDTGEI